MTSLAPFTHSLTLDTWRIHITCICFGLLTYLLTVIPLRNRAMQSPMFAPDPGHTPSSLPGQPSTCHQLPAHHFHRYHQLLPAVSDWQAWRFERRCRLCCGSRAAVWRTRLTEAGPEGMELVRGDVAAICGSDLAFLRQSEQFRRLSFVACARWTS